MTNCMCIDNCIHYNYELMIIMVWTVFNYYRIVQWPLSIKKGVAKSVRLGMKDVFTLYPNEGISDHVIDFYVSGIT